VVREGVCNNPVVRSQWPMKNGRYLLVCGGALLAAGLSALMLRHGIQATSDSWTYWEASISLLEHGRYTRLLDDPIIEWPPLFSAYLGIVQAAGRQTGLWVIVAVCLLCGLNVLAWGFYTAGLFPTEAGASTHLAFAGSLAFAALFVPLCSFVLLAQLLMLAFVGGLFGVAIRAIEARTPRGHMLGACALAILLCGALLSHNSALVYVPPVALMLILDRSRPFRSRALASTVVSASIIPWFALHWGLGQMAQHASYKPFTWDVPATYLAQSISGIGDFFLSSSPALLLARGAIGGVFVLGLLGLFARRKEAEPSRRYRAALLLTALSYAFLFLIFTVTWVDSSFRVYSERDPLSGRFLWYIPLALVPVYLGASRNKPILLGALVALVLAASIGRTFVWVSKALVQPLTTFSSEALDLSIRPDYFLTSAHPERRPSHAIQVIPPTYPWMRRWNELDTP
jgi:hypothetical protein